MAKYMPSGQRVYQGFFELTSGEIIMFEYCETSKIDEWFKAGKLPKDKTSITFGTSVKAGNLIELKRKDIRSFWGEDLL